MSAEIHQRLLGFLLGEFAKSEGHVCTSIQLFYAPGMGNKDEPIQEWIRKSDPDLFEPAQIPDLCSRIIDIAEGEADAKQAGKHRFVVRTKQYMGGQANISFALQPSYSGDDPGSALIAAVQGGGRGSAELQIIANHANQLMRNNTQMHDGSIRVLVTTNLMLQKENGELRAENFKLKGEVEAARHDRLKEEFEISMAVDKNNRANAGFQKLLQLGTVVAAKITAGVSGNDGNAGGAQGGPSPLQMLVGELKNSLRPEQIGILMNTFDMPQKIIFGQIMEMVMAAEQAAQQQQQQPGSPPTSGFPAT